MFWKPGRAIIVVCNGSILFKIYSGPSYSNQAFTGDYLPFLRDF